MIEDFVIEVEGTTESKASNVQLPVNILQIGEFEADDIKVYIRQSVFQDLERYSAADTTRERGTILIGSYSEVLGKVNVIISDYIEAKYTDSSASTLTFTHQTWKYVNEVKESQFSKQLIIGWQHTHPSYGIFLSNYDMFIQENFFNLPFQIAYVIDPIQHLRGFFQWKNGKVVKLKGYYLYDDVGKQIKIDKALPLSEEIKCQSLPKSSNKRFSPINSFLTILVLLSFLFSAFINQSLVREIRNYKTMVASLSDEVNSNTEAIKNIEKDDVQIQASAEENDTNCISFFSYVVEKGDTLESICRAHNINFESNRRIIIAINGLEDPDTIFIGQTLLIPQ